MFLDVKLKIYFKDKQKSFANIFKDLADMIINAPVGMLRLKTMPTLIKTFCTQSLEAIL
jgi:hypothetical protein